MEDILEKFKKGKSLNSEDYDDLLMHLNLKMSLTRIITSMLITILTIVLTVTTFIMSNPILAIALIPIGFTISILTLLNAKNESSDLALYIQALDELYDRKLAEFRGYFIFKTAHHPNMASPLVKKNILFMSNGHQFALFDDFLIATDKKINSSQLTKGHIHALKLVDQEVVNSRPFIFKPQDISSFFIVNSKKIKRNADYHYKNHTQIFSSKEYRSYVQIYLMDRTVLRVGVNVLEILRSYVPTKEVKSKNK